MTNLIFRPLLVDGCLGVDGGHFTIYVDAPTERATSFRESYEADGGVTLPPRLRFTVAHEIAHTFFFTLKNDELVAQIDLLHHRQLESLEQACNHVAGRLLMPQKRMDEPRLLPAR